MSPAVKGLIFAGIAVVAQLIMEMLLLRLLLGASWGATAAITISGVILFGVFGFFAGWKEVYALEPRPIWSFIVDVTWSSINTVTGMIWMIWCVAKGNFQTPDEETQKRGIWVFSGAALPGADATTIGTVMGGMWLLHETVHVQQERIFGPFYWPVYLISYVSAMMARFLTGRFHDPHWEAYERVVMEDWAYRAAPSGATSINIPTTVLWFFLTTVNAFAVGVLFAVIPGVGALPALIGLALVPWWVGLIVILAYALFRSFFPKGRLNSWQLIYNG